MSADSFDVIVVGCGGMGSAAAFELARRGRRVLALEQFAPVHDQGSSHGHTRIIRQAYFEHPAYVPLVRRAYERWYDLEQCQGVHLLTGCGCLSLGRPDSDLVAGVLRSAAEHSLPVERLSADDLRARFPMFRASPEQVGVLEHSAGFLAVEECVKAHARAAEELGAVVRFGEPAQDWQADGSGVSVRTERGSYRAARLVLTAGPWAGRLLGRWGAALTVMRQVVFWIEPTDPARFRRDVFPVFISAEDEGHYYGLPMVDRAGVKVARHYGAPELTAPDAIDRTVRAADEEPVRRFLARRLPEASGAVGRSSVCTYTLTPDRHFVIGLHPEHAQVALAAGFSGHGFKFASVVGEILADLAEQGRTRWPIEMFHPERFAPAAGAGG
jgi:sarcosine oxidase